MRTTTALPTLAALVIAACLGACEQTKSKAPALERRSKPPATRLADAALPAPAWAALPARS